MFCINHSQLGTFPNTIGSLKPDIKYSSVPLISSYWMYCDFFVTMVYSQSRVSSVQCNSSLLVI